MKKTPFVFLSFVCLAILLLLTWYEVIPSLSPLSPAHKSHVTLNSIQLYNSFAPDKSIDNGAEHKSIITPLSNSTVTNSRQFNLKHVSYQTHSFSVSVVKPKFSTSKLSKSVLKPVIPDCSTVHIAMVATGDIGSIHLHTTIKSVLVHRSTPLHFHFITDDRAKTVLHTMMRTWLVPSISHDYYDLTKALANINSGLSHCSRTLSIHLNLDLVLPNSVQHVIVIEPASVVRIDLAKLLAMTISNSDRVITVCQTKCVHYCNDGSQKIELTKWGAVGVNLVLQRETFTKKIIKCKPSSEHKVDHQFFASDYIKHQCISILEEDGEKLRYKVMNRCREGMEPLLTEPPSGVCKLFEWERKAHRRELPFLLGHRYKSSGENDLTMATHLDYNRLNLLERILGHWDGPASVAIHVTDLQVQRVVYFLLNSKSLQERRNVSYHLVFRVGPSYPPNHGRELAHRFVSTPYMFILDVDFVSSHGLYGVLKEKLKAKAFGSMDKTAVVIPAFETDDINLNIPHTKSEMVNLFMNDTVRQFYVRTFKTDHNSTNYGMWKSTNEVYSIRWVDRYEPYYVIQTSTVSFDHQFIARFRNKVSHCIELHMAGYQFLAFPNSYIIHMPHNSSLQNMSLLRRCNRSWYINWLSAMRYKYHYVKNDLSVLLS